MPLVTAALTSGQNWGLAGLTVGSLILSVGFIATCGWHTGKTVHIDRKSRMGQASWDFSQSFATNITIIGSVLTAIVTSNALPADTHIFAANTYSGLAIVFGVAVVVAPLLYNGTVIRVTVSPGGQFDTADEYHGTVWGFLLAASITTWGLVGSLATSFLTLVELERDGSLSLLVIILIGAALAVTACFFARYLWVRVDGTIMNELDPVAQSARVQRSTLVRAAGASSLPAPDPDKPPPPPPSPHWTLL
jgi:hypothetical protein